VLDHPNKQFGKEVVPAGGEVKFDLFGGGRVALGRSTGTRSTLAWRPLPRYFQVAVFGQPVEVVAGDVGMNGEQIRDLGSRRRFRRLVRVTWCPSVQDSFVVALTIVSVAF
jgi:hypothetical protein